jgi:hypothetical protein
MTVAAGGAFVIYSAMLTKTWMWTVVTGIPVAGVVAFRAIVSKHSLVKTRISMAASAEGRRACESLAVTALAGEIGVTTCQPESG